MAPLSAAALVGALLAATAVANPIVIDKPLLTAPIVKRLSTTNMRGLLERDQARAQHLITKGRAIAGGATLQKDAVVSFPVVNEAVTYIANVAVGSPATNCASPLPRRARRSRILNCRQSSFSLTREVP